MIQPVTKTNTVTITSTGYVSDPHAFTIYSSVYSRIMH